MTTKHLIAIEVEPKPGDMQVLVKGLVDFNTAQVGGETQKYLFATVRDSEGEVVGGLLAVTYLGWLHVQAVWLQESLRGLDYGTMLMQMAEEEALRRGCKNAFVETLSFQALPFYEKCGYKIFSKLPDMPPGGARYALTKVLE
jgi:GNAT superfamily N-acetyltransferase